MEIDYKKLVTEYRSKRFCILRDVINDDELDTILEFYNSLVKDDNGRHLEVKFGDINNNLEDSMIANLFRKISIIRVKVLSLSSNFMMHRNLSEDALEDEWERLMVEVMQKYGGWSRFMQYGKGHKFNAHKDAIGEVMAILHLSQPLTDYTGGLYVYHPETKKEECVDDMLNTKDLILCDANYYMHRVDIKPLTKTGRLTYFVNFNPLSSEGAVFQGRMESLVNKLKA